MPATHDYSLTLGQNQAKLAMARRMTTGETRGLIAAIIVMAIVILAVAWSHGRFESQTAEQAHRDTVTITVKENKSAKKPKNKKEEKKSRKKKVKKAKSPKIYPQRNPLSEPIPAN